jgi:hypothetical protein
MASNDLGLLPEVPCESVHRLIERGRVVLHCSDQAIK